VEGALGRLTEEEAPNKVYLPKGITAGGHFVSGYGSAILEAYMNGSILHLNLSSQGG
jgi:hypothetical protein